MPPFTVVGRVGKAALASHYFFARPAPLRVGSTGT
jgi:hypothetical protein